MTFTNPNTQHMNPTRNQDFKRADSYMAEGGRCARPDWNGTHLTKTKDAYTMHWPEAHPEAPAGKAEAYTPTDEDKAATDWLLLNDPE